MWQKETHRPENCIFCNSCSSFVEIKVNYNNFNYSHSEIYEIWISGSHATGRKICNQTSSMGKCGHIWMFWLTNEQTNTTGDYYGHLGSLSLNIGMMQVTTALKNNLSFVKTNLTRLLVMNLHMYTMRKTINVCKCVKMRKKCLIND